MARAQGVPLAGSVDQVIPPHRGSLGRRLLSTLILLPLFVWMVAVGPVWLFGAVMVLAGALGQWEFTGMFERAGVRTFRVLGLVGGSLVTASFALPVSERVVFTTVAVATFSPPKTKSLFTLGAYTPEASALLRSGTGARGVQVLATGSNFPNSLIFSEVVKE